MQINDILPTILGRDTSFLHEDMESSRVQISESLNHARVLVIGAAGSIGSSFVTELAKFSLAGLHLLDVSENNLVEVVRQLRSGGVDLPKNFRTFAIDFSALEMQALLKQEQYDYVLNFSALKHVRSERDAFTLMRLLEVNVSGNARLLDALSLQKHLKRVFSVSSDKSVRPANLMGASKAFMERIFLSRANEMPFCSARFANVAFSDGSLLHGFNQRFARRQPISAPNDVKRYFVTPKESGELCLMSCLLGENRDIFFPKLSANLHLITFSEIAKKYLLSLGFEPYECETEEEARNKCAELIKENKWPCYFFESDTTGEKDFEEFYTDSEELDMDKFSSIGIIKNEPQFAEQKLLFFDQKIKEIKNSSTWSREEFVKLFHEMIPDFGHKETGKFLDQRM